MTIGEKIKKRREELGLSQEELAHRLGLSGRSSVSKIEKSQSSMQTTTLRAYADALNVSLDYFYNDNYYSANLVSTELIASLNRLNEQEIQMLTELVNYFLENKK